MSKSKETTFQSATQERATQSSSSHMTNEQNRFSQLQDQIMENIREFNKNCSLGFQACLQAAQDISYADDKISMNELKDTLHQAFDRIGSMETMQHLAQQMSQGTRFSDLIGIKPNCLWMLYKGAKNLAEQKRFQEAEAAFCFLTFMDQSKSAFWLGLGHASFHLNHFSRAATAYQMASVTDSSNFWPFIFLANCYEACDELNKAEAALIEASRLFNEQGQSDSLTQETISQRLANIRRSI